MTRTLVTGATGRLGRVLCRRLATAGHSVRGASRSPPTGGDQPIEWATLDLVDGTGIERAVADVDVVIHAATAPRGDTEAVDVEGTKRLLTAATAADISHVLYVSIVGVDDIPYTYYEHKRTAERLVLKSDIPATVLRATQFHGFVADLLDSVARLPVWPLPTAFRAQPVAVETVAEELLQCVESGPGGRMPPVGGPEVQTVGDLARTYREIRGLRRPIVRVPIPGAVARGFRAGRNTCPDRAVGTVSWAEWLTETFDEGRPTAT